MKKTFLVKRNSLLSGSGLSWSVAVLACVIVLVCVRFLAPNAFLTIVAPLMRTGTAFAFDTHLFFSGFENTQLLSEDNRTLLTENLSLGLEDRALQEKNDALTALLGDQSPEQALPAGIVASVVASPPESPYDTLIIGAGSVLGIKPGMDVFGAGGVPMGVVSSVLTDFSRVTLFSTPGQAFYAWAGTARTPVMLMGTGGGTFSASVSRTAPVAVGDALFIPGSSIPIGTVTNISGDPSVPTVTLHIAPAINPFSTTWVVARMTSITFSGMSQSATSSLP